MRDECYVSGWLNGDGEPGMIHKAPASARDLPPTALSGLFLAGLVLPSVRAHHARLQSRFGQLWVLHDPGVPGFRRDIRL